MNKGNSSSKNSIRQQLMLFLVICALMITKSYGQIYPFQVNTLLQPPSSPYLSDYFEAGSGKLSANVTFNDFNEPSWKFRLRLTIESNDITIQTSPTYIPPAPIIITPGVPMLLTDEVLAPYFEYDHLSFQGITRQQIATNGKLPDGHYAFCFEVLDYNSGTVLSSKSCQYTNILSLDEPMTISPVCGNVIAASPQQNIMFQWQLSNGITPAQLAALEYNLKVWEITDPTVNPLLALQNNKVLLVHNVEHLIQTNYLYDASAPALDAGKRYVYQVQVKDINGRDLFKNNGKSEVCWFAYGFPTGGIIPLEVPADNAGFARADQPYFKWDAPTNITTGQQFNYVLKIVKISQGQTPEQAMQSNPVWHDETTAPTTMSQWDLLLSVPFETMTDYAWQVTGYSSGQEIAKSTVRKFRGPGAIDQFNAGMHIVKVTSTTGNDLNNLTGTGRIKFGTDSSTLDVNFVNIKLRAIAGRYVLEDGQILQELTGRPPIDLNPDLAVNGHAVFYPHHVRLNKQDLSVQGYVKWPLPHAVATGEAAFVKTTDAWMNFDEFKLLGNAMLNDSNDFQLADPYHFRLKLLPSSDFLVVKNKFVLRCNGKITLPQKVKGPDPAAIEVSFFEANQIYYMASTTTKASQDLLLVPNSKIFLSPVSIIIDLSETESPGTLASDKNWKGVYWEKFDVKYEQHIDNTNQLISAAAIVQPVTLDNTNGYKAWVNANGLVFKYTKDFAAVDKGTFNKFASDFKSVDLNIENSVVESGHLKGSILIPLISMTEKHAYTVPVTSDGFEDGYMDVNLNTKTVVLNDNVPEKKVTMKIKQAVFADRERLDLTVDLTYHALLAQMNSLSGLKLWGNGNFGFTVKNGVVPLTTQVTGLFKDKFDLVFDSVGAARVDNVYGFSFRSTLIVSDDVAGKDGPPRMDFMSAEVVEGMPEDSPAEPSSDGGNDGGGSEVSFLGSKNGVRIQEGSDGSFVAEVHIEVNTPSCEFEGDMKFMKGDKDWGDCFQLYVKAKIKSPFEATLSARFVIGEKDDDNYWFIAVKGEDLQIKIGFVQIYALEGRVYSHMNHQEQGVIMGEDDEFDYRPDPNISYGGFLMVGLTDAASGGKTVKLELAVEMAFNSSGGLNNIGIQANIYLMNIIMAGDTITVAKGTGILYYNVPEEHWIASFSVEAPADGSGKGPLCATGTLKFDYSPSTWSVELGGEDPEERVQITPGCAGFGGFGWFTIDPDTIDLGIGISWGARLEGPEIDIGIYDITPYCYAHAEIGVSANFTYMPSFVINSAKVWILLEAGIGIHYENVFDSGDWDFARVRLAGEVIIRFNPKPVNIAGSLEGEIEVIGIGVDFSLAANIDL
jgi:TANFOR domain-containing protein